MPDACTFRNVIKAVDTQQVHTVFVKWMRSIVENVTGVVAMDGKQARRTKDGKKSPLHVVSAFSAECGLVLGQLACEEKSNEITAIPKLLEINGCIVTIDAMGTQTEIAKKITKKGADYILALKENQEIFYEDVRLFFEEYRTNPTGFSPVCCATSHSQGHGRYESRTCYICEDIGWLEAVRNGVVCLESASSFARWNRLEKFQNRHIILSIVVKVCPQVRSWTQNAAIGELKTNCTGYWICNFVRTRAEPELPILMRISMSCATGPITS